MHPLKEHPDKEYYFEHIVQIERASNPIEAPYTMTPEILKEWCSHPSTFAFVCEANKQHAGHYILLKLKSAVAEDIVHHRRNRCTITKKDFCAPEEKGSYLTLTLFARSGKVATLLNIEHYYHLVEHMNTIDNIAIFSRREDTVPMTRTYGIHLVASGVEKKDGYTWYGLTAPLEDILFTDTIIEAVF